jgi:FkbM family methyltransferase
MRRLQLLRHFNINKIFDVGANKGQYAILMRQIGFKGAVVSFEPVLEAHSELKKNARHDKDWLTSNIALGDFDGKALINVSANSYSSSILNMLSAHVENAPNSVFIRKEEVKINKIDSIIGQYYKENDNIFLKIDTQGYEKNVIDGARESIQKIKGIQIEMSLVPLYEREPFFIDMIEYMKSRGFNLYSIENGFFDSKYGRLLQVDGIFFR